MVSGGRRTADGDGVDGTESSSASLFASSPSAVRYPPFTARSS